MKIQNGERIVFIGDSVTDCNRVRPIGEGYIRGTGEGYVSFVENYLNAKYPERIIRVTNMGIGGNNVVNLKDRFKEDVIDLKPDWVSINIGINDVWRQFDRPSIPESHISPEVYEATYEELINLILPKVKGLLLITPYYIESLKEDKMRARMDEYTAIVIKLAKKYNTMLVNAQDIWDKYLVHRHSSYISWDRVHPNGTGALLLANEIIKQFE